MIDPNNPKPSSPTTLNRSHTIHSTPTHFTKPNSSITTSRVKNLCNLFESRRSTKSQPKPNSNNSSEIHLPGTEDRVVIYFTSLRGIRTTYDNCYTVRTILKLSNVYVDERDVSMDTSYKTELLNVLRVKQVSLPQVFVKGKYLGGAEVVKQLHECGQVAKVLNGVKARLGVGSVWKVCDACGDVRFVPCGKCCGSRKVFDEVEERLVRCVECNENGLVRCLVCSL